MGPASAGECDDDHVHVTDMTENDSASLVAGRSLLETEVCVLTMALKRTGHQMWSRSSSMASAAAASAVENSLHPTLLQGFLDLKASLVHMGPSLAAVDPNLFLAPFLDVIRSEVVTGSVTGLALNAVNKILAYGLLNEKQPNIASAVENLADAVTHARFVGVDPGADEVVLMKILVVLRTLILSSVGVLLTNESVCEILQSTFRICFETRLTELLRKTAENVLNDMIQLLFSRLPSFSEESLPLLKKLKMRSAHGDKDSRAKKRHTKPKAKTQQLSQQSQQTLSKTASDSNLNKSLVASPSIEPKTEPSDGRVTPVNDESRFSVDADVLARSPIGSVADLTSIQSDSESIGPDTMSVKSETEDCVRPIAVSNSDMPSTAGDAPDVAITVTSPKGTERTLQKPENDEKASPEEVAPDAPAVVEEATPTAPVAEFVNAQGVTFTPTTDMVDETGSLVPYGLPCVRELFRFLTSLINTHDSHNQDSMVQIALALLSTALETGARHLDRFESLLALVKDDLARHLVGLLAADRLSIFSSSLLVAFMMFEHQRRHLKYQLEIYLSRLIEVVCSESQKVTYEHKELALEIIVRYYRIPGFLTQLYLNFDCDMYTANAFEDLTKMLSKNAFPVTGLYSTHFLSLDALLTVVESIEAQCQRRIAGSKPKADPTAVPSSDVAQMQTGHGRKMPCSGFQVGSDANNRTTEHKSAAVEHSAARGGFRIPTHEEVMALKHKKKLITSATEQFNSKPTKGIAFMKECGLIKAQADAAEIAHFMRKNPHLDKKQIGEYVSNRKHLDVLDAFVKSFDFNGLRIDESLRLFLETFRLPGEAPLISLIVEYFADSYQKSNNNPFRTTDAAYTLCYAIIMLNVDQHNVAHTRVSSKMTADQFQRNLRGTNDGADHDPEVLLEIYHAIKNEEIVMPAEQTGLIRENYLWKCVLKRGQEEGHEFILAPNGYFDHDLFSIVWGPTVAALAYVFDKSQDDAILERAIAGFQKCGTIAAHYHMSDVFDNLVISLCKFTTLLTMTDAPAQFIPGFGMNKKALLATKTVFALVQRHGDILRDGWKNVVECLLQLFKCQLLPKSLLEAEDYIESTGRVKLLREEVQTAKAEPGFLVSFVSFISMSSESQPRVRTPEEDEFAKIAQKCVRESNLESLVTESKFLLAESLQELVKYLVTGSTLDEGESEHATLFYLELLVRITIQNRDRVQIIWRDVSDHLARLIVSSNTKDKIFVLERSVTALLRLAVRLSRKEDLASTVVQSLQILLALKVNVIFNVCRHIAFGLHELLRNNAANIHEAADWAIIFDLMQVVGAGVNPECLSTFVLGAAQQPSAAAATNAEEDSGHKASSESEAPASRGASPTRERSESISSGGWIVLESTRERNKLGPSHPRPIVMHDSLSYLRCCESLAFLIRDVAHVTPDNFGECVQTLRTFVEVSCVARHDASVAAATSAAPSAKAGAQQQQSSSQQQQQQHHQHVQRSQMKRTPTGRAPPVRKARSAPNAAEYDADESDSDDLSSEYHHVALQLLDLMLTLHTRAGQIYVSTAEDGGDSNRCAVRLWSVAWCPLLQGMARYCCDRRSHIRTSALTTLQRAFLFHEMQALTSGEWESAFTLVLFPMLTQLLIKSNPGEKTAMEETRTRAATLLGKVFLQHLTPLAGLPTFALLWKTILDFMEKFMKSASSDLLADAVPESLKNMLLVMDTAGIFFAQGKATPLWSLTWDTLETFLPALMSEVFGTRERVHPAVAPQAAAPAVPVTPASVPISPLPSPMDPPVLPAYTFATVPAEPVFSFDPPSDAAAPPVASKPVVTFPKMPEFAPLPPPPLDLPPLEGAPVPTAAAGFQPIALANPTGAFVALANPKAIPAPNPQLSSYFPGSSPPDASRPPQMGNVLTAAFTPTMATNASTVIPNSPVGEQSPASAENH